VDLRTNLPIGQRELRLVAGVVGGDPHPPLIAQVLQLTLQADLDADGTLDAGSEEVTRWLCATAPPRLSRIIGAQSLPVAAPVSRCGMRYFDASGSELLPGAGGLDTAGRARVRRVVLDFAVDPASAGAAASRIVEVALRVTS